MRSANTENINNVFRLFLKQNGLERKYLEAKACRIFPEVMGKTVENRTKKIYCSRGNLFVHLDSAVLRNELFMMKSGIISEINKKLGSEVIKEIILR